MLEFDLFAGGCLFDLRINGRNPVNQRISNCRYGGDEIRRRQRPQPDPVAVQHGNDQTGHGTTRSMDGARRQQILERTRSHPGVSRHDEGVDAVRR
ncbi:hypothetical protein, partial [Williamsia sp.]|uniref:hypothetical protein n=1 Tax=Williamsia sp. TaxID=1872085 RepID=UPI0025EB918A